MSEPTEADIMRARVHLAGNYHDHEAMVRSMAALLAEVREKAHEEGRLEGWADLGRKGRQHP